MGTQPKSLVEHLRDVYGLIDEITPESGDYPSWTIENGVPYSHIAGTHPTIKFNVGVDLVHGAGEGRLRRLREVARTIERILRNFLPDQTFNSRADIHTVYDAIGAGLTLKKYESLPPAEKDALNHWAIFPEEYDSVKETCTNFEVHLLQKIKNAGNLADAYVWTGGRGSPEELSFYDKDGFYLRPPVLFNFLNDANGSGGPEKIGLNYAVTLGDEQVFHQMELRYLPQRKVLTIEDCGLWKPDEKNITRKINPQPTPEQKATINSPLVRLLESFRQ